MKPADILKRSGEEISRTRFSKTFKEGGTVHVVASLSPAHYQTPNGWEEVDLTIKNMKINQAPYSVEILPEIGAVYKSSDNKKLTIRLRGDYAAEPVVKDNTVRWEIAEDTVVEFVGKTHGIEFFKYLQSPKAIHSFEWEVDDPHGLLTLETQGKDANKRNLEIVYGKTEGNPYVYTETVTGRAGKIINPKDRIKRWSEDILYPLKVDVSVNELIAVNNDDGLESEFYSVWNARTGANVTWTAGNLGGGFIYNGGVRFQTINVPQGATINSATLTLNINSNTYSPTTVVEGDDVDDAAAWSNTSRPSQITPTTATVVFNPVGTGDKAIDVTAIVQEIVNRAGWVANNDMRFGIQNTKADYGYLLAYDFNVGNTALSARLDIEYTTTSFTPTPLLHRMGFNGGVL
jgi:hypothetical protein